MFEQLQYESKFRFVNNDRQWCCWCRKCWWVYSVNVAVKFPFQLLGCVCWLLMNSQHVMLKQRCSHLLPQWSSRQWLQFWCRSPQNGKCCEVRRSPVSLARRSCSIVNKTARPRPEKARPRSRPRPETAKPRPKNLVLRPRPRLNVTATFSPNFNDHSQTDLLQVEIWEGQNTVMRVG